MFYRGIPYAKATPWTVLDSARSSFVELDNSNAVRRPCPMPARRPVKVRPIHYNHISQICNPPPQPPTNHKHLILSTTTGNTFVRFTKLVVVNFHLKK